MSRKNIKLLGRKPPPFFTFFNFSSDVHNKFHIGLSQQHNDKYGYNLFHKHSERGDIQFFDKLDNKTKNAWAKGRCLLYQAKRREIASKGRFKINSLFQ